MINEQFWELLVLRSRVGASSTLATIWSVDDARTASFMKRFYEKLIKNKKSRAEALRLTQKQFLSQQRLPDFWIPYTLVGDWR